MKLTGVVIRHLPNNRPAVLCTIPDPADFDDPADGYYVGIAKEKIVAFKKKFIEFKEANYYLDLVDEWGEPVRTLEL